mmetsp:Transcript_101092/g.179424  ORF Transcript_101092/g.179424 Transcript_101092/m.179424 type:complete len:273 (+) Transcript_101092:25-843(+)
MAAMALGVSSPYAARTGALRPLLLQPPYNTPRPARLTGLGCDLFGQASAGLAACMLASLARQKLSRRRPALLAKWSEDSIGHALDYLDDGATVRRRNAYTTPEGFCVAVAAEPMATDGGASEPRDHYGEIKIENDAPSWASGLDFGFTTLTPEEVGQANERGLAWADFQSTWVLRDNGQLRFQGRAYPASALPGAGTLMQGWDATKFELGDTIGLQVTAGGRAIVGWVNGERAGRMELDEKVQVPTERNLYLIADIVSKAAEVKILDVSVPK